MTEQNNVLNLNLTDPIFRYLVDGGSWATAVEMDYEQNYIPKWTRQLKASLKKKSPSAQAYREVLINDLRAAYAYCGVGEERFQSILASILTP